MEAFEAAYVPALVRLLADDVVLEMPPLPLWYRCSRDYDRFMKRVFTIRGMGGAMRMLTAGGQPALAAYASSVFAVLSDVLPHGTKRRVRSGRWAGPGPTAGQSDSGLATWRVVRSAAAPTAR
ncbi:MULTISPECIES: sigma-70 family RNA polymerase sigma factor family protein [unclassified Streptomyces]|uniref:hypothetical protein n=1 Tax=Streptomyces sp. NPDC060005 TaxID=3347034 RepID=UPI0036CF1353